MEEIKKVRIFANDTEKAQEVEIKVRQELLINGFDMVDNDNFDLGIAIGGDGSFLRMVNNSGFKQDALYVGINAGTLGFAQDVSPEEIKHFIEAIKNNDYSYEEIGIQNVVVETAKGIDEFQCLNEMVIREEDLKTVFLDVYIDDTLLENFVGDGLLTATSFGSTAYNLNYGGSIVFNEFDTLQITPIAPFSNKTYRTLSNSLIIPSTRSITFVPQEKTKNLLIYSDGRNEYYRNVIKIETCIANHIHLIRKKDYNYVQKINDKFIK